MESHSSSQNKNVEISTRKRIRNADDSPTEGTTKKRRRLDSRVASGLNSITSEEVDENFSNCVSTNKEIKSADDLPPEMIEEILKHLCTGDLLQSRQVNWKWNEVSSRILRYREDNELSFYFDRGLFVNECTSKSLEYFIRRFKKSQLFYTHFNFGDLKHFGNEDINKFFSLEGKCIRSLKITMNDSENDVQTLRKLLLRQVPNLKKLEIKYEFTFHSPHKASSTSKLFDDSNEIRFPKLEVLVIHDCFRKYRTITHDILKAACNLKRLDMPGNIRVEDLTMLQSTNKLHCLKNVKFCLSEDLIAYLSKSLKKMNLKLESLDLSFEKICENQQLQLGATSVINQLLESSKDVIGTLAMEAIGWLPGVVFPKVEKLYKLDIRSGWTNCEIFPPLFDMADAFPNLKEFDMHVACTDNYFPSPQLMPSVEVLRIFEDDCTVSKEKLTKMVPNVKTLVLDQNYPCSYRREEESFVNGIRVIFNNLTKLEKIDWKITESTFRNLLFSLDAAMTGLPDDFCKKNSVKFHKKKNLSSKELASIETERKFPSILDLKDLKKLYIHFVFGIGETCWCCSDCEELDSDYDWNIKGEDDAGFTQTSKFYRTGFTKVTELLAFQLIPNLEVRITKN